MTSTPTESIWPPHEAFYLRSMLFNARSAARSIEHINAVFHVVHENSPEDPVGALPVLNLLGELQNVVLQSAALSRYFWPVRAAHVWRGNQLRKAFGISDDSPLRSRDLRNAIEHFDEQLDLFLEDDLVGHIIPEYVGPLPEANGVPVHMFRAYYVDTGSSKCLVSSYPMPPLAQEVLKVHAEMLRMESEGGRF